MHACFWVPPLVFQICMDTFHQRHKVRSAQLCQECTSPL